MHTVVVRKTLAAEQPGVVQAIYRGFQDAKTACEDKLVKGMTFNNMATMIPWLSALSAENPGKAGGRTASHATAARPTPFCAINFELGLSKRRLAIEDVFVPYLLEDQSGTRLRKPGLCHRKA